MRLREMQHIVRAEIGKLKEITFGAVVVGQTQYQDVAHWRRALEGVNALIAVAPLADQATRCVGAPWGKLAGEPGRIEPNEGNQIQLTIAALTQRADVLLSTLDSLVPNRVGPTVSVELPVLTDLADLASTVNTIQVAIGQPTNLLFGPCVTFQSVDVGSNWIEVAISATMALPAIQHATAVGAGLGGAYGALKFVGRIVDLGFKIAARRQQLAKAEQFHRILKAEAGLLEKLAEQTSKALEAQFHQAAGEVVDEHAPAGMDVDKKNEAKAAVVAGAFKVAELLDRKARFIPSLPEGEGQEAGHEAIKHWPSADEIRYVLHSSPIAQLAEQNTPKKKE
jgi:hypothetical protein